MYIDANVCNFFTSQLKIDNFIHVVENKMLVIMPPSHFVGEAVLFGECSMLIGSIFYCTDRVRSDRKQTKNVSETPVAWVKHSQHQCST